LYENSSWKESKKVYPPVVIYPKRKEDTPMTYLNDTQRWAEVKNYYVYWEKGRLDKMKIDYIIIVDIHVA
jgi:hypothetical protein